MLPTFSPTHELGDHLWAIAEGYAAAADTMTKLGSPDIAAACAEIAAQYYRAEGLVAHARVARAFSYRR